jgi:hypothetical protein
MIALAVLGGLGLGYALGRLGCVVFLLFWED